MNFKYHNSNISSSHIKETLHIQINHVFEFSEKLFLQVLFSPLLCETMFQRFIPKPPGEALILLLFLGTKNSSWRWGSIRDRNH